MQIYYIGSPEIFGEGASGIHVARMCEAFSDIGHDVTLRIPISSRDEDRFFSFYGVKKSFKIEPSIGFKRGPVRHFFHGINSFIRTVLLNEYDFIITRNGLRRVMKSLPSGFQNLAMLMIPFFFVSEDL